VKVPDNPAIPWNWAYAKSPFPSAVVVSNNAGVPFVIVQGEGKDRKVTFPKGRKPEEAILALLDLMDRQTRECKDEKAKIMDEWRTAIDNFASSLPKNNLRAEENLSRKISCRM